MALQCTSKNLRPFDSEANAPLQDRRLPLEREFFHVENARGHLGYDLVPAREGRIARNDYDDVPEDLAHLLEATQARPRIQPAKRD